MKIKEIKNLEGKRLPDMFNKEENIIKIENFYGLKMPNMFLEENIKETNYGLMTEYTLHMYDENMEKIDSCKFENMEYNIKKIMNRYILKKFFPSTFLKTFDDKFGKKNTYSYIELKLYSQLDNSIHLIKETCPYNRHENIDNRFTRVKLNMNHEYNQQFLNEYTGDVKILFGYAEIFSIPYLIEKGIVNPYNEEK